VITPRRTRLVRVPDLHAFRDALRALAEGIWDSGLGIREPANPEANPKANPKSQIPNPFVVVPTRAAARNAQRLIGAGAELVTRDELYDRLHAGLAHPPRRLTSLEREVMAGRAARVAAESEELAFRLRPGLVAEIVRFYDQLRRQSQQVQRFEELLTDALGGGDDAIDRGAERLRQQTRFLAKAFREYERLVRESGACDEHLLRDQLIAEPATDPVQRVIVTVADWIADADGLYVADFDLLTRIPGLQSLDIVATEAILGSGFHQRLHEWLPGIEEIGIRDLGFGIGRDGGFSTRQPVLMIPPSNPKSQIPNPADPWWTCRDREEEIVSVARQIKANRRRGDAAPLDRTAVVFKQPLPYLYVASEVLPAAGIPYQTVDALPLAAEPVAAALDLALEVVGANFSREPLIALLRSPHFAFRHEETEVTHESTSALDRALSERRYLGDPALLREMAEQWPDGNPQTLRYQTENDALPALHAALGVARHLASLSESAPASRQVTRLLAFWDDHLRPLDEASPLSPREARGRAAIRQTLTAIASVHAAHDDIDWTADDLALAVRRSIEDQTFEPDSTVTGIHLLDDRAARYGDFDDISVVGLVETDWPERPRRNIFYPPALLKSLGWPSEKDRRAGADAHFLDLLGGASRRTSISTFTLDEDAIVSRSMQLDEVPRARLSAIARASDEDARVFVDEALSLDPPALTALDGDAQRWADLRLSRSPAEEPQFHGTVGTETAENAESAEREEQPLSPHAQRAPRFAFSISALETYLDCPFKFFAQHVLRLEEEPDDEEVMDPRHQGQFVHEVFEEFFKAWQDAGRGAITPANLDAARALFTEVVDKALAVLPAAEAGLERTRLLGSPAAAGLGEAVFRMEAERPVAVVERLLEHRLDGEFTIVTASGPRVVALRGKADRLDLLEDGTFRLIDYKLGWPPNPAKALQLPLYSICAEQRLSVYRGRRWSSGEAVYLAFKGPRRVVPLFSKPEQRRKVLADAQQRLADAIDAIERGEFPPTPDDVWRCETCTFAAVCRKDYVGEV
jgi:RecB family exonuclease